MLFSPKIMKFIFWSTRGSCLTYFNKIFLRYRSNFQVLPKLSDRGGRQKILLKIRLIWDEKNSMWGQGFFYWLEIAGSRIFWPYYLFVISYPIIMIIFWTHLKGEGLGTRQDSFKIIVSARISWSMSWRGFVDPKEASQQCSGCG